MTGGQNPAGAAEAADQGEAKDHHALAKPHRLAGTELRCRWWCHVDLEDRQIITVGTSKYPRSPVSALQLWVDEVAQ